MYWSSLLSIRRFYILQGISHYILRVRHVGHSMQCRRRIKDEAVEPERCRHGQFKEPIIFQLQRLWECLANYRKLNSFKSVKSCRYSRMICSHWAPRVINVSLECESKSYIYARYFDVLTFCCRWKEIEVSLWTSSGACLPASKYVLNMSPLKDWLSAERSGTKRNPSSCLGDNVQNYFSPLRHKHSFT